MEIEFIKMGINGEGIGYLNQKPVFCQGVLPHETADVKITEEKQGYCIAECVKITKYSPDRVHKQLTREELCAGATLSVLSYEKQLEEKRRLLAQALWKYGHVRETLIRDFRPSPSQIGYRTACKLPVRMSRDKLVCGMFEPGTNHFTPIEHFKDHTPDMEKARTSVLAILNHYHLTAYNPKTKSGIRYLILRTIDGLSQLTLVTGKDTISQKTIDALMTIQGMTSVTQSINTQKKTVSFFGSPCKTLAGRDTLPVTMHELSLELAPEAFFQLNVEQANNLYKTAIDKINPCHSLIEAYCGIGVMSMMAKDKAEKIIGIESVPEAIRNAKHCAALNHIFNIDFRCADAAEGIQRRTRIDCLLVDPPRSGLSDEMIEAIMNTDIKRIVYISCNPATLGKNLRTLKQHFQVRTVIPFDMFPNTPHIESVTVLEKA